DAERHDTRGFHLREKSLDVLVAGLQAETGAEGNIADVGYLRFHQGSETVHVVIGPDTLDGAHRARPQAGARAVGHPGIQGHTDSPRVAPGRRGPVGGPGARRGTERGRDARVRLGSAIATGEDIIDALLQRWILRLRGGVPAIAGA